jgi:hypothetical protein
LIDEEITKAIHSMMFAVGNLDEAAKAAAGLQRSELEALRDQAIALQRRIEDVASPKSSTRSC